MVEPPFALERFQKSLGQVSWRFFQFDKDPKLTVEIPADPLDSSDLLDDPEYSDSSRSSSHSSSSNDVDLPRQRKSCDTANVADEALVGIHRSTWHIMVPTDPGPQASPLSDQTSLKTACGRQFLASKISAQRELSISQGHTLRNHVACRKGFVTIGADVRE